MRIIAFLISYFVTVTVHAQMDPSSALLMKPSARPSARESGLDSSRYTVKPSPRPTTQQQQSTTVRVETKKTQTQDSIQTKGSEQPRPVAQEAQVQTQTTEVTQVVQQPKQAEMKFPEPMAIPQDQGAAGTKPVLVTNPEAGSFLAGAGAPIETQSVTEVVLGGSDEELSSYKEMLNPDDRRHNLLEISLAPAFIYNSSRSPYLFRDYTTASPGVSADAKIWFSPFFGAQASYMTSLSGSVNDSFASQEYVPVTQTWTRAGLRSRTFLATGRYSPSLTFGVDYYDYNFSVPTDSSNRGRLRTTGAQLSLDGEWVVSGRFSWLMGFTILPKAKHKETSTDLELKSGSKADTNGVGISFGGRVQYDRKSAMFFRLSHSIEKHVYSGEATTPDPRSGVSPRGVPVTNSFTILQLGYTWGS